MPGVAPGVVSASTSPSLLGQGRESATAPPAGRGGTRGSCLRLIAHLCKTSGSWARGGCCWHRALQEEGFGGNTPRCHAQLPSVTIQQHFCPKPSPVPAESADAGTRSQGKALQGFLAHRKKSEGSKLPASPRNSPPSLLPQAPSSSQGC